MSPASPAISFGMVAENSSVWRCLRQLRDDPADRDDEAEVEHVVGLVEHENLGRREVQLAAAHVIEQAAGRGDQDVEAAREQVDLRACRDAADDDADAEAGRMNWP